MTPSDKKNIGRASHARGHPKGAPARPQSPRAPAKRPRGDLKPTLRVGLRDQGWAALDVPKGAPFGL